MQMVTARLESFMGDGQASGELHVFDVQAIPSLTITMDYSQSVISIDIELLNNKPLAHSNKLKLSSGLALRIKEQARRPVARLDRTP